MLNENTAEDGRKKNITLTMIRVTGVGLETKKGRTCSPVDTHSVDYLYAVEGKMIIG